MTDRISESQAALSAASHLLAMQADALKEAVTTMHLLLSDSPAAAVHAKKNLRKWTRRGLIPAQDGIDVVTAIEEVLASKTPQMGYNEVTWDSKAFARMRHALRIIVGNPDNSYKVETAARKMTMRGWFVGQLTLCIGSHDFQWKQRDMIALVESCFNHGVRQCGL